MYKASIFTLLLLSCLLLGALSQDTTFELGDIDHIVAGTFSRVGAIGTGLDFRYFSNEENRWVLNSQPGPDDQDATVIDATNVGDDIYAVINRASQDQVYRYSPASNVWAAIGDALPSGSINAIVYNGADMVYICGSFADGDRDINRYALHPTGEGSERLPWLKLPDDPVTGAVPVCDARSLFYLGGNTATLMVISGGSLFWLSNDNNVNWTNVPADVGSNLNSQPTGNVRVWTEGSSDSTDRIFMASSGGVALTSDATRFYSVLVSPSARGISWDPFFDPQLLSDYNPVPSSPYSYFTTPDVNTYAIDESTDTIFFAATRNEVIDNPDFPGTDITVQTHRIWSAPSGTGVNNNPSNVGHFFSSASAVLGQAFVGGSLFSWVDPDAYYEERDESLSRGTNCGDGGPGGCFTSARFAIRHRLDTGVLVWAGDAWQPGLGGGLNANPAGVTEYANGGYWWGGGFDTTYNVTAYGLAALDANGDTGLSGRWISLGNPMMVNTGAAYDGRIGNGDIRTTWFDADEGTLVIAGQFARIGNTTFNSIAITTLPNFEWTPLGSAENPGVQVHDGGETFKETFLPTPGVVHSIVKTSAEEGDVYFFGGSFFYASSVHSHSLAKFDIGNNQFLPIQHGGIRGRIDTMTEYEGELIVGGSFAFAGDLEVLNIASYHIKDNTWSKLQTGLDGNVFDLEVYGGLVWAAGTFSSAAGLDMPGIARWDGKRWKDWNCDCTIDCQEQQDSIISCPTGGSGYELTKVGDDLVIRHDEGILIPVDDNSKFKDITSGNAIDYVMNGRVKLIAHAPSHTDVDGDIWLYSINTQHSSANAHRRLGEYEKSSRNWLEIEVGGLAAGGISHVNDQAHSSASELIPSAILLFALLAIAAFL